MTEKKAELVKPEGAPIAEFNPDVAIRRIEARVEFLHKLRKLLKDGEDYAQRPGYPKPSLEKPGAEKIAGALNAYPKVVRIESEIMDEEFGLKGYTVQITLIERSTGTELADGIGYARAYKNDLYVNEYKIDPKTGKKKKVGKRLDASRASWANNKALKMAKKSALIDAALTAGCLSGYFTQDLEGAEKEEEQFTPMKDTAEVIDVQAEEKKQDGDAELKALRRRIWAMAKKEGWDEEGVRKVIRERFGVESSKELSMEQLVQLMNIIVKEKP